MTKVCRQRKQANKVTHSQCAVKQRYIPAFFIVARIFRRVVEGPFLQFDDNVLKSLRQILLIKLGLAEISFCTHYFEANANVFVDYLLKVLECLRDEH